MNKNSHASGSRRALIFQGGWEGHQPALLSQFLSAMLEENNIDAEVVDSLDPLGDAEYLAGFDLIVPCWTAGALDKEKTRKLSEAVRSGIGLAGVHGGMGDAFRGNLEFEWMVGGLFLGHPHVGDYTVDLVRHNHPVTAGLPESFPYHSEQYYMAVDPGVTVLADAAYTYEGHTCRMPVAWTKQWGKGRVFYCALGHDPAEFERFPEAKTLTRKGLLWAARD